MEIEPIRTYLKSVSPGSAFELHDSNSNQYRALYWLYYDLENYDNYTNEERAQLWSLGCFYFDTIGGSWYNSTNWMSDSNGTTVCDWYGLTCNVEGWVIEMDLSANRVRRNVPNEFSLLTSLQYVGLSQNSLGPELNPSLFDMPSLQIIDFDTNGISKLPKSISRRNRVKELYLADNSIDYLPESMVDLTKLEVLWLWKNSLSGTLPDFMRGMSRLGKRYSVVMMSFQCVQILNSCLLQYTVELDIEDNFLSGDLWPVPEMANLETLLVFDNILGGDPTSSPYNNGTSISDGSFEQSPVLQAIKLKTLDLSTNYYYGSIPSSIGSTGLSKVEELYLEDLELDGEIPAGMFTAMSRLAKLYLGKNYLTSVLPEEIGNAKNLGTCYLLCCVEGSLVQCIMFCAKLFPSVSLRAQDNYRERDNGRILSEGIIGTLPTSIHNLTKLQELRLENNFIGGTLHSEFGKLTNLVRFRIELNVLRGSIPKSFENLNGLSTLTCSGNYMVGPLVNRLGQRMTTMQLHDNAFVGTIPTEWGMMTDLRTLDLSYNDLTG